VRRDRLTGLPSLHPGYEILTFGALPQPSPARGRAIAYEKSDRRVSFLSLPPCGVETSEARSLGGRPKAGRVVKVGSRVLTPTPASASLGRPPPQGEGIAFVAIQNANAVKQCPLNLFTCGSSTARGESGRIASTMRSIARAIRVRRAPKTSTRRLRSSTHPLNCSRHRCAEIVGSARPAAPPHPSPRCARTPTSLPASGAREETCHMRACCSGAKPGLPHCFT
jgi:hypothetical protein